MSQIAIPAGIDIQKISIMMISEALPENQEDYFYGSGDSNYVKNTIAAFNRAGIEVKNIDDIINRGVYLTVAVKAPRKGSVFPTEVIREHSYALEEELNLFPNLRAILLMGDVAIKALNYVSQRVTHAKTIPDGATYKLRDGEFYFKNIRVFPSYLQTGMHFLIDETKTKRMMIPEDIRNAFEFCETAVVAAD